MDTTLLYGFLIAMFFFIACWFGFVVPSERKRHERKLALIQKRIAAREAQKMHNLVVLESERLQFFRLADQDAGFILAILNDTDFLKYIGDRGVRTLEDARQYLRHGPIESYEQNGYGLYRVNLKGTNEAVGMCGLVRRDGLDAPDIGFAFLPSFRGQGFATEATLAVLEFATAALKLPRVLAIATPDNGPSNAILKKAGMSIERTVRLPGEETDLNLYALDS